MSTRLEIATLQFGRKINLKTPEYSMQLMRHQENKLWKLERGC